MVCIKTLLEYFICNHLSIDTDFNSFHADYDTVTSVHILCKFTYNMRMYVAYFSEKYHG